MFRLETLQSGLTVLGEPDAGAGTVALGFFVRTGARDEAASEMGASHFLEHLLFKGSNQMSGRELNARFDALGANSNAFTSEETTVYHAACLPENWRELLELLAELFRPALRSGDVAVERGVILEEIAMYDDDPASRAFDALRQSVWGTHPLGHLVLGTPQTVEGLTPEVLRANFSARYGTSSTLLVACGNFDWEALLRAAKELTDDWPRGGFERLFPAHEFAGGLEVLSDDNLSRAQFTLLAPGLSAANERREAAVVLAEILGGDNGRLYWSLVDSGLADSADLSHVEFEETGAFEGGWTCDPERARETLDIVRAELARVQAEGVTEAEVARAAKKLAVGAVLRAETPYARLFTLGMDFLYFGRPVTLAETVARVERVTAADVLEVLAARPFDQVRFLAFGPLDGELQPLEEVPAGA